MDCKKGEILRSSYRFVNKSGKDIKVKAKCIKDKGLPGKGPKLIQDLKKGTLSNFGYSSKIQAKKRKEALTEAVKNIGYGIVVKKLNAISILNKNTNPKISEIFKKDMNWVQKNLQ